MHFLRYRRFFQEGLPSSAVCTVKTWAGPFPRRVNPYTLTSYLQYFLSVLNVSDRDVVKFITSIVSPPCIWSSGLISTLYPRTSPLRWLVGIGSHCTYKLVELIFQASNFSGGALGAEKDNQILSLYFKVKLAPLEYKVNLLTFYCLLFRLYFTENGALTYLQDSFSESNADYYMDLKKVWEQANTKGTLQQED